MKVNYTTRLKKETIKKLKIKAAIDDVKECEVIEYALNSIFKKRGE